MEEERKCEYGEEKFVDLIGEDLIGGNGENGEDGVSPETQVNRERGQDILCNDFFISFPFPVHFDVYGKEHTDAFLNFFYS